MDDRIRGKVDPHPARATIPDEKKFFGKEAKTSRRPGQSAGSVLHSDAAVVD
jgi:hypothetical protein